MRFTVRRETRNHEGARRRIYVFLDGSFADPKKQTENALPLPRNPPPVKPNLRQLVVSLACCTLISFVTFIIMTKEQRSIRNPFDLRPAQPTLPPTARLRGHKFRTTALMHRGIFTAASAVSLIAGTVGQQQDCEICYATSKFSPSLGRWWQK